MSPSLACLFVILVTACLPAVGLLERPDGIAVYRMGGVARWPLEGAFAGRYPVSENRGPGPRHQAEAQSSGRPGKGIPC